MKKLISLLLVLSFSSNSFAECDFSVGITKLPNGNYEYSKECHVAVGNMRKELDTEKDRSAKLFEAVSLKDVALQKADQRIDLWRETSFKLEDRMNKVDELRKKNEWLYFGLGVLTMIGAGFALGQLNN